MTGTRLRIVGVQHTGKHSWMASGSCSGANADPGDPDLRVQCRENYRWTEHDEGRVHKGEGRQMGYSQDILRR